MMSTKVLVVESNPGDLTLIERALATAPGETFAVASAERLSEAMDLSSSRAPDAVLLDLNLPDSSGLETLRQLSRADRHFPIIVLTEPNEEGLGIEALQSGADDYVSKGELNGKLLPRAIRYAVERKGAQEQLRRVKQLELLRQLTGATMHEFNNLLTILTGNLTLLSDELLTESSQDRGHKMKATLGRMSALIEKHSQFTCRQIHEDLPLVSLDEALNNLEHILHDYTMEAANPRAIYLTPLFSEEARPEIMPGEIL